MQNFYVNAILRSKMLLDEDMEVVLDYCKFCSENRSKKKSWCTNITSLSLLCLWGISICKYRLRGLFVTTPFAIISLNTLYKEYKVKRYKYNIKELIEVFAGFHKINRDIMKYLKARELFMKSFTENVMECIKEVFNNEIAFISYIMNTTKLLCEFCKTIEPENWSIEHLQLDKCSSQEEYYENFLKLHDVIVLTISKCLACIAVAVSSQQQTIVLNKIIPDSLKSSRDYLYAINRDFTSMRSLATNQKVLLQPVEDNNKPQKSIMKLEESLSKFLTHLQFTFEIAQQIHSKFDKKEEVVLETLGEEVFALQEQLTFCEQKLDQFCGIYGILIKKTIVNTSSVIKMEDNSKENPNSNAIVATTVKKSEEEEEEEILEGDEEYELFVNGSDDEFDEKSNFCEENDMSSPCLLLVLQELKDKLKERQILRAKKLGLSLQEIDSVEIKKTVSAPPKPQVLISWPAGNATFVEIGTSSFANAIKSMAQQRQYQEDTFQDSDDNDEDESN